jgi:DNA-binding NarL/FixJ family response regulator
VSEKATSRDSVKRLTVLIVEDHALVRSAIAQTLDRAGIEVVDAVPSAEDALTSLLTARPDVILLDIGLPGMNGIELLREIAPRLPDTKIVMLTASVDRDLLLTAMMAGASGYLTKDTPPEAFVRAVKGVVAGDLPMSRQLAAYVVRDLAAAVNSRKGTRTTVGLDAGLTPREAGIARSLIMGLTDREIGRALGISPRTVGRHVGNVLSKLQVKNRYQVAGRLVEDGIESSTSARTTD